MRRASFGLIAALSMASHGVRAETPPDHRASAQELFDSGLALARAGDYARACPKFLASQTADPKTTTLLNLANCYERNGQPASAWGAYKEAETSARAIKRADWETQARTKAALLEPTLVRLTVVVGNAARLPGLAIKRDGVTLLEGEWGAAIPVDPGTHVVTASADDRQPWRGEVRIARDDASVAVPVLEPKPRPVATAGPQRVEGR